MLRAVTMALMVWAVVAGGPARAGECAAPPPSGEGVQAVDPLHESPEERDARMAWWREARFGMFIHWGLYAIPAGEWGTQTHHAEWIRTTAQIRLEEYDRLLARFNPVNFDARAWARMAREAGMKYIVITTKHHDGFALFDSAVSDFDVMATPFGRDIIRELADAARAEGLQIGFYHSIMDWHHPDYLPRRAWETDRAAEGADFERFEEYLHAQVTELLTNYGPIGVMWFDGEWESTWSEDRGRELYALCRRLQPGIIVNNRVGTGREGMAGLTREGAFGGDFGTPEQEVPATGFPGVDWESCMTMNDHWGYNAFDHRWKSTTELIRTLVDIASKGGNYLLNVGPRGDGTFPPEAVDRLREIGAWMGVHGEAIHGSTASPFEDLGWGRCTLIARPDIGLAEVHCFVFDWPSNGRLALPGLASNGHGMATTVGIGAGSPDPSGLVAREGADVVISGLARGVPDRHCPRVSFLVDLPMEVHASPVIEADATEFIDLLRVTLSHPGPEAAGPTEVRYTLDGTDPVATSRAYDGPLVLGDTTTVRAQAFRGERALSPIAEQRFTRVTAVAGVTPQSPRHGYLNCEHFEGMWDRMPRFETLTPVRVERTMGLTLETRTRDEGIALRFTGFIYARTPGVYRFALSSDDGSRLYVADRLVVDNDGLHATQEREGTLALAAGYHPIRVEYFNRTGGFSLVLRGEKVGVAMVEIQGRAYAVEGGEGE